MIENVGVMEILEQLRDANPVELKMVRDTAESLLALAAIKAGEAQEIEEALAESEAQFERGEGISVGDAWQKLGI